MARTQTMALGIVGAALFAGCASTLVTEPTTAPTVEVSVAEKPCIDFAVLTDRTADLVLAIWDDDDAAADQLDGIPDEFDAIALRAEGEIGERMAKTTALLQETRPVVMSTRPEASASILTRSAPGTGTRSTQSETTDMLSGMRKWNLFTFWTYVLFGTLAAIAAVAGVALLFFAPGAGVVSLIVAVVLAALSFSTKRSYDSVTRQDS